MDGKYTFEEFYKNLEDGYQIYLLMLEIDICSLKHLRIAIHNNY